MSDFMAQVLTDTAYYRVLFISSCVGHQSLNSLKFQNEINKAIKRDHFCYVGGKNN